MCQTLAEAVGSTKTWHAYLSTRAGDNAVTILHARERIGTGPWYNANLCVPSDNDLFNQQYVIPAAGGKQ